MSIMGNRGKFQFKLLYSKESKDITFNCWIYLKNGCSWQKKGFGEKVKDFISLYWPRNTITKVNRGGKLMEFSIVTVGLNFLSEGKQGSSFLRLRLKMHACRCFLQQWMIQFRTTLLLADENISLRLRAKLGSYFCLF